MSITMDTNVKWSTSKAIDLLIVSFTFLAMSSSMAIRSSDESGSFKNWIILRLSSPRFNFLPALSRDLLVLSARELDPKTSRLASSDAQR